MVSLVTGSIGLVAAITIVLLIRRDHLHARFGLWWLSVALAFLVLGVYPQGVDRLAAALGIANGPDLALTLAVTALVVKILVMDIGRSRNETRIQRLVQRTAMLEAELQALRQQGSQPSNGGKEPGQ